MFPARLVKATVVDIRKGGTRYPRTVVADANVLYFVYYDFTALDSARVTLPRHYQLQQYPKWWKKAKEQGVTFCSSLAILSEFVQLVERMELHCLWETDPQRPELDSENPGQAFSPKYLKTLRYHYHDHLSRVRADVMTVLRSVRKDVELLPRVREDPDPFDATTQAWLSSIAEIGDAAMVAEARRAGPVHVVSDDADLLSFDGITLYTANQRAVDAAGQSKP
ncbi:MAG: hypothetical protein ACHRXM_07515 [Isosphaerales bacterium]